MRQLVIRHFDGCPNWTVARDRLAEAATALGLEPGAIELEKVETVEEAERLGFQGSPTVLVDGVDPFADPASPVGLSCRVYRTEAGVEGAPSVKQLEDALRR